MQKTTGLRSILSHHAVYTWFRRLTGSEGLNRRIVEEYIRPRPGDVVLDLGCGPADVLAHMPQTQYYGLDLSEGYVRAARARYGDRGTFICGSVGRLAERQIPPCDLVLALGLTHHLDDGEVVDLLRQARRRLKPGGRLVGFDPCFTERQHPLARAVHRLDRGRNVRFEAPMAALVRSVFPEATYTIRTDLCRVPSTVIIFEARNAPGAAAGDRPAAAGRASSDRHAA